MDIRARTDRLIKKLAILLESNLDKVGGTGVRPGATLVSRDVPEQSIKSIVDKLVPLSLIDEGAIEKELAKFDNANYAKRYAIPVAAGIVIYRINNTHVTSILKKLLSYKSVDINATINFEDYKQVCIMDIMDHASTHGYDELLADIISSRPDLNINRLVRLPGLDYETTPFVYAMFDRYRPAKFTALYNRDDLNINQIVGPGMAAVHYAIASDSNSIMYKDNSKLLSIIMSHQNADIYLEDGHGGTPFVLCMVTERYDLAKIVLSYIDVNRKDSQGSTPLHHCIMMYGYFKTAGNTRQCGEILLLIRAIMSNKTLDTSITDDDGSTALRVAMDEGLHDIVALFE